MKTVLINGGNGYIGENLEKKFDKTKYDIVIADKGMTVYDYSIYDGVVHLAALSGIAACKNDFQSAVWDNILSAFNAFDECYKHGIPCVFTSSQAAKTPTINLYATIKAIIEVKAKKMNMIGGNIRVLRLANVYGGIKYFEKKNTVVKKMLNKKFQGGPVHVHGDGTQERDFIHVDDVCEYIIRALEYEGKIIEPVDIGTGVKTSVLDLARMTRHDFAFTDARSVGVDSNVADPTKAIALFKYKASFKVQTYIDEVIDLHSQRVVI